MPQGTGYKKVRATKKKSFKNRTLTETFRPLKPVGDASRKKLVTGKVTKKKVAVKGDRVKKVAKKGNRVVKRKKLTASAIKKSGASTPTKKKAFSRADKKSMQNLPHSVDTPGSAKPYKRKSSLTTFSAGSSKPRRKVAAKKVTTPKKKPAPKKLGFNARMGRNRRAMMSARDKRLEKYGGR